MPKEPQKEKAGCEIRLLFSSSKVFFVGNRMVQPFSNSSSGIINVIPKPKKSVLFRVTIFSSPAYIFCILKIQSLHEQLAMRATERKKAMDVYVSFVSRENGDDVFERTGGPRKKYYVRQRTSDPDTVVWAAAQKMCCGYEPIAPLKAGTTVKVVSDGRVVFQETTFPCNPWGDTEAKKVGLFSDEELAVLKRKYGQGLVSFETWKNWLFAECHKSTYSGYLDNWLYWERTKLSEKTIATLLVVSGEISIVRRSFVHTISKQKWTEVLILNRATGNTRSVIGYKFSDAECIPIAAI